MNPDVLKKMKERKKIYILVISYYLNGEKETYCLAYTDLDEAKCDLKWQHNFWLEDYEKLVSKGRYIDEINLNSQFVDGWGSNDRYSFSIYEKDNYINNHIDGCIIEQYLDER